jgi:hypothetical protein
VFSGSSNPSNRSALAPNTALIAGIAAVLVYTLFVGFGIMGGRIDPDRAYLFIALPCLVPAIWYLVGFLRAEGGDIGLVASSLGWFLAALTFFSKHLTIQSAVARGMRPDQLSDSSMTWLFAFLSIAGVVGGAILSGRYWMDKTQIKR